MRAVKENVRRTPDLGFLDNALFELESNVNHIPFEIFYLIDEDLREYTREICQECGSMILFKDINTHDRSSCIKIQMKKLRKEIREKEKELEKLAQELERKK